MRFFGIKDLQPKAYQAATDEEIRNLVFPCNIDEISDEIYQDLPLFPGQTVLSPLLAEKAKEKSACHIWDKKILCTFSPYTVVL